MTLATDMELIKRGAGELIVEEEKKNKMAQPRSDYIGFVDV